MNKDLIFGFHSVQAALESNPERIETVLLADSRRDKRSESIKTAARLAGVKYNHVPRTELDQLVGSERHQGVVARCRRQVLRGERELADFLAAIVETPLVLVLDGIQDPHNLGACLRCADAVGAHAVILPLDHTVSVTPAVRRTASGAAENIPVFQVRNLARALDRLKDANIWLVGADHEAPDEIFDLDLTLPLALILGGEGKGLRRLTRERCDWVARLPMQGSVSNLNVAVATGVCLYETLRQRRKGK